MHRGKKGAPSKAHNGGELLFLVLLYLYLYDLPLLPLVSTTCIWSGNASLTMYDLLCFLSLLYLTIVCSYVLEVGAIDTISFKARPASTFILLVLHILLYFIYVAYMYICIKYAL